MLPSGSILTGLRSARTNSNGGTRRAAVVRSVSAPNRYHGSALARSVRRWAARTAASRKTVDRLLGGSRRAQEIHPFPRVRQFKTYGSLDKSSVQLMAGSAEEQSRASQSFLSRCCVGSIRDAAARPIQASELGETWRNGLRVRLPSMRCRRVDLRKVRLTARPMPVSVMRPARAAAPGNVLIGSLSISLLLGGPQA